MDPSFETILLNAAYATYIAATIPRGVVPLRVTLVAASVAFVVYGLVADSTSIIVWNAVFGLLHLYQLARIAKARRLKLSESEQTMKDNTFPTLSSYEFFFLWSLGESVEVSDTTLISEGAPNTSLFVVVVEGQVEVHRNGQRVAAVGQFGVVGEQSLLTADVASADAVSRTGPSCENGRTRSSAPSRNCAPKSMPDSSSRWVESCR